MESRHPAGAGAGGLLLLALASLAGCGGGASPDGRPSAQAADLPSIVVVTIDTLRADRLGCYGYGRGLSPHIDRLAEDAVLFERAVTAIPSTLPAHVSLWTSLHPVQHGVLSNFLSLDGPAGAEPGVRFLAEELARAGYRTAALVSASPVKRRTGIDRGFLSFDEPEERDRPGPETALGAADWLAAHAREPFFLWVHLFDPHAPYVVPKEWLERYPADGELEAFMEARRIPPKKLRTNRLYDAEVALADAGVGTILDALRAEGLYERTAIVVLADHGEGLGQHGHRGHGALQAEQLHVPLLIKLPRSCGVSPGRRDELVSILDVVPTLVRRLDLPVGRDFREQLTGRDLFGDRPREYVLSRRTPSPGRKWIEYALVGRDWKLIWRSNAAPRLFDLRADPHELTDVAAEHPDVVARLEARMNAEIERFEARRRIVPTSELATEEAIDELEKLGYTR